MAHTFDIKAGRKEVLRVTLYLTILTIAELVLGFVMMNWPEDSGKRHAVKAVIIVLMIWKAYFIVGFFMHLKHEVRGFINTIMIPLSLFIWFIIAFLYDGNSFKNLRNKYDAYQSVRNEQKMEKKESPETAQPETRQELK
ncbi:MAG: cytochrome C oxidase subunit IV family protein [Chitinophagaceae bacterium]|jgi:cytochrome c oxidase subunit IV|nr:cytochrome C oxidase subunit IV family protein [Chitinophagaceae bacterium]